MLFCTLSRCLLEVNGTSVLLGELIPVVLYTVPMFVGGEWYYCVAWCPDQDLREEGRLLRLLPAHLHSLHQGQATKGWVKVTYTVTIDKQTYTDAVYILCNILLYSVYCIVYIPPPPTWESRVNSVIRLGRELLSFEFREIFMWIKFRILLTQVCFVKSQILRN